VSTGALRPAEARRDFGAADLLLLVLAVAATLALTWALIRGEWDRLALVVALAAVVALVLGRTRLARLRLHAVLATVAAVVPMLSIMGATVSLPGARALFAARLLLGLLALLGICRIAMGPVSVTLGPRGLRTMLLLWFAWMAVTLLWAPDPGAGLGYLFTVLMMIAVTMIVAACAARPRTLALLLWLLGAALVLTLIVAAAELVTGRHLPGSAALLQTLPGVPPGRKATAWFVNTNDLATYLSICWPFLLLGALATRGTLRRLALVLALLASGAVVLYTGSRSSLVTMFLETLVAGFLAVRHGWLSGKRALAAVVAVVVLLSGMAVLAFNNADLPFIRQFRVAGLAEDIEAGTGSGAVRVDLARAGLSTANRYFYAGVGPGNAEALVKQSGEVSVGFGNLHSWWFEVFVNSGLPGFVLFMIFFFGLIAVAGRALRRAHKGADAWLAAATFTALVGWIIGAFGPSTAVSFAPMWVLFGLGLAVAVRGQRYGVPALTAARPGDSAARSGGSPTAVDPPSPGDPSSSGDPSSPGDPPALDVPPDPDTGEADR
jgi:teichuronic acid biosynthesis protein TuaE